MSAEDKTLLDRVAIVTGANTGLGRATAEELARRGAHVFLACRSADKTQPVIDAIRAETKSELAELLPLDLGSFPSIRACAEQFLERKLPLHMLINNAGLAGPRGITAEGFELAFGVNHVGHFLLTMLLLDRLKQSAPSRIVNVSSRSHFQADSIDYDAVREATASFTGLHEYAVSKLANVLFTVELSRRLKGTGVTTYAVHPGAVASDVWRRIPWPLDALVKLFMRSNEDGARTQIWCATADELSDDSGLYYADCKAKAANPVANDEAMASELWAKSVAWTGVG